MNSLHVTLINAFANPLQYTEVQKDYSQVHSSVVEYTEVLYSVGAELRGCRSTGREAYARGAVGAVTPHGGGRRIPRRGTGDGLPLVPGGESSVRENRAPLAPAPRGARGIREEKRALGDADGAAEGVPRGARQRARDRPGSGADEASGRRLFQGGGGEGRDAHQVPA